MLFGCAGCAGFGAVGSLIASLGGVGALKVCWIGFLFALEEASLIDLECGSCLGAGGWGGCGGLWTCYVLAAPGCLADMLGLGFRVWGVAQLKARVCLIQRSSPVVQYSLNPAVVLPSILGRREQNFGGTARSHYRPISSLQDHA